MVWGRGVCLSWVRNDEEGIREFVGRLLELRPQLVVMEACGGYEVEIALGVRAWGLRVYVVNPIRETGWIAWYWRCLVGLYVLSLWIWGTRRPGC